MATTRETVLLSTLPAEVLPFNTHRTGTLIYNGSLVAPMLLAFGEDPVTVDSVSLVIPPGTVAELPADYDGERVTGVLLAGSALACASYRIRYVGE